MFGKKKKKEEKEEKSTDKTENKKKDYEQMVEENVEIHKMPKNIKKGLPEKEEVEEREKSGFLSGDKDNSNSSEEGLDKTKVIGGVIMFAGIVILLGGIYLGYAYFIKPNTDEPVAQNNQKEEFGNEAQENNVQEDNKNETDGKNRDEEEDDKGDKDSGSEKDKNQDEKDDQTDKEGSDEDSEDAEEEKETKTFKDTDGDGLSDLEEKILGIKADEEDSDGDGYNDAVEVKNLYNPAGEGIIGEAEKIDQYESQNDSYSLYYPIDWDLRKLGEDSTMFKAEDGSFIQVVVQKNNDNLSIEKLCEDRFGLSEGEVEFTDKNEWSGAKKKNESVFYITGSERNNIYVISMTSMADNKDQYSNIFNLFVNSFEVL